MLLGSEDETHAMNKLHMMKRMEMPNEALQINLTGRDRLGYRRKCYINTQDPTRKPGDF
jgi:hypothetical protein